MKGQSPFRELQNVVDSRKLLQDKGKEQEREK